MSLTQIALVLQIAGFFCASLFIAVLKIERINRILYKIKQLIIDKVDKDKLAKKPESIETVGMILLLGFITLETPKIMASMRKRGQITQFKYVRTLIWIYFIEYPLLSLLILTILVIDAIDRGLIFLVKKLTGHEALTNSMIILGSFLIFIGLIIELIASY